MSTMKVEINSIHLLRSTYLYLCVVTGTNDLLRPYLLRAIFTIFLSTEDEDRYPSYRHCNCGWMEGGSGRSACLLRLSSASTT